MTAIYPYCYKIKETEDCPQLKDSRITECLHLFVRYLIIMETSAPTKEDADIATSQLINCLKHYGDLYKKLKIELYVSNKKQILFPNQERVQAHFNTYLRQIGAKNESSPKKDNEIFETVELYSILLNSKFREIYNKYYTEFADNTSWNSTGGKIKKNTKRVVTKKRRTK